MKQINPGDVLRQIAVLFAAIFQVYASYGGGSSVGTIAQENRSLILPSGYAFSIWGPIFILCGIYAIYQALPAMREDSAFRAMGWWAAAAFLANGLWIYAYSDRQFILAQGIIIAGFVCAVGAYIALVRARSSTVPANVVRWIVAPAFGLLAGWLTAASIVGLAGTLVSQGFAATGQGAEVGGSALLLACAGIASALIWQPRDGISSAWIAYGAAIIWALVAIIVEQRSISTLVTAAAIVGIVVTALALVAAWKNEGVISAATAGQ